MLALYHIHTCSSPQGALAHRQAAMLQGLSELEAQEQKVLAATSALHQVLQQRLLQICSGSRRGAAKQLVVSCEWSSLARCIDHIEAVS